MRSFKDAQGRSWDVAVDYAFIRKAKSRLGLDFLDPESNALGEVFASMETGCDAIALALESQFEKRGLEGEDRYEGWDGKTLRAALDALVEELADFFLSGGRPNLEAAVKKMQDGYGEAVRLTTERVKALDVKDTISKGLSGNAPDGSA